MKKITFILLMSIFSIYNLYAQLSFTKAGTFGEFIVQTAYTSQGWTCYDMEVVNDTDIKFTIFNEDLSVNRSFTITGCVRNKRDIMLVEVEPKNGYDVDYCYLTQTLFNSDEKFEVMKILYTELETEEGTDYEITGIQVISEDGTILGTLPQELHNTYLEAFTLGRKNYLAYYGDEYDENGDYYYYYDIYEINGNNSDNVAINKVKTSYAYPNPVKSLSPFTIILEKEVLADGYITITDLNGKLIDKQTTSAGKEINISTRKLRRGQYIYSIYSQNEIIDSGKIIVK